jgi:cold shock CspA family protein
MVGHDGEPVWYTGRVTRLEAGYGFIQRDGSADRVFFWRPDLEPDVEARLGRDDRVRFTLAFTFAGPRAAQLMLERDGRQ